MPLSIKWEQSNHENDRTRSGYGDPKICMPAADDSIKFRYLKAIVDQLVNHVIDSEAKINDSLKRINKRLGDMEEEIESVKERLGILETLPNDLYGVFSITMSDDMIDKRIDPKEVNTLHFKSVKKEAELTKKVEESELESELLSQLQMKKELKDSELKRVQELRGKFKDKRLVEYINAEKSVQEDLDKINKQYIEQDKKATELKDSVNKLRNEYILYEQRSNYSKHMYNVFSEREWEEPDEEE